LGEFLLILKSNLFNMTDEELLNDLYYVKKNYDGVEGLYKKVK
jgi:hypothetical protein